MIIHDNPMDLGLHNVFGQRHVVSASLVKLIGCKIRAPCPTIEMADSIIDVAAQMNH